MTINPILIFVCLSITFLFFAKFKNNFNILIVLFLFFSLIIILYSYLFFKFSKNKFLIRIPIKNNKKSLFEFELMPPFNSEYLFLVKFKNIKTKNNLGDKGYKLVLKIQNGKETILKSNINLNNRKIVNDYKIGIIKMKSNEIYTIRIELNSNIEMFYILKPYLEVSTNYYL